MRSPELLITEHNWRLQAACKPNVAELFCSPEAGDRKKAKEICKGCPVASFCLEEVMSRIVDDDPTIRGGYTNKERQALRKNK